MKSPDDYYFDRYGSSTKVETDDDFDRIITDRNRELEELDGGDKYDYAEKKEDRLIYEVPKGTITEYGKLPEIKGGNGEGSMFTVTDQAHADNIFRVLGGNSLVEYGSVDYNDSNNNKESSIWTNTNKTGIKSYPAINIAKAGGTITKKTHSHPFRGGTSDFPSSAYPSPPDIENLDAYDSYTGFKNTKHKVYSPYNPFKENLPYTISFDKNGPKEIKNSNHDLYNASIVPKRLTADYKKNVAAEEREKFKNYYLWK